LWWISCARPRGEEGPATTLLTSLPPEELAISVFVLCELLAGAALASRSDEKRQKDRRFSATLRIAYPDEAFADQYAMIVSTLKRSGRNPRAGLVFATIALPDCGDTRDVVDDLVHRLGAAFFSSEG
jgi:predicted nucleic acid-binding protein